MAEYKKTTQEEIQPEETTIGISMVLIQDLLRSFFKLWWLVALLAALFSGIALLQGARNYTPMYKAEATFTVETYTDQSGYTFFYDNRTADQMARTFPFLLDSDLLMDRVKIDLDTQYINGTPKAEVIPDSNLFTLSVTSRDPQAAYDILYALIRNYPEVSEYVIGKTQLNMIDYPEFPTEPYNSNQHLESAGRGLMISLVLSALLIICHALTRNTVRKESDITDKLYTDWIGSIPLVVPKRANRVRDFNLNIHNSKVGSSFRESFHGIGLQIVRKMEDKKVLLLTATTEGEGTSVVTKNLALELADKGKRVLVLDGNFQKSGEDGTNLEEYLLSGNVSDLLNNLTEDMTVLRCSRALTDREVGKCAGAISKLIKLAREKVDYVLIDAPICQNLDAISLVAEPADAILYVIRQDVAKLPQVMNCFEDLNQFEAKIMGCVLNGVHAGITGYGYGYSYGYGYGRSYHYGRYGGYGYGEEKTGKGE